MKKFLFLFVLCMFSLQNMAQIEMFDESIKKVEVPKAQPYDSLSNISPQKYGSGDSHTYTLHHLIGQTLLYCGDPDEERTNVILHRITPFEKGAYYRVDGILPDDVRKGKYHRMQLTNIKTGEQIEEGSLNYNHYNFKWVVVGHYEKMKSLYINKDFVYVGTEDVFINYDWKKANGLINLETDTVTTNIPKETIWTCVGVQVKPRKEEDRMTNDKRSPIVLIFDNPTFGKHYCYLESDNGKPYKALLDETLPYVCGRFQLKSYYYNVKAITAEKKAKRKAELTRKFGASNANLILEGKVRIGMTKAMCEESWGYPDDINTSIGSWGTHEQWVYGNSYLYFEGNKLTAIQN